MEIPELGKNCNVQHCSQLDFLPIVCAVCQGTFCKEHFQCEAHSCPGIQSTSIDKSPGKTHYRHICEMPDCKDGELVPVVCSGCQKNFCCAHRHQSDHLCPALSAPDNSSLKEASAKVQNISEVLKARGTSSKSYGHKSDKTTAKVQLMKLKLKAIGDKGLPVEERIYFLILLPKGHKTKSQAVFVSNQWSLGRCVDCIAELCKVPNKNHITGAEKLSLFSVSDGIKFGQMSTSLKDLLVAEKVFNGQSVILEYKNDSCQFLEDHASYKS
ncbi:AN1-type zinc finger protein 1-like [Oratosquilla oratoria]|uniref:AN1-type zinc finger protein 1-like n=1 Tax=Oratosquilla oratoria TaxID=337810 RepID=UPI003F772D75